MIDEAECEHPNVTPHSHSNGDWPFQTRRWFMCDDCWAELEDDGE